MHCVLQACNRSGASLQPRELEAPLPAAGLQLAVLAYSHLALTVSLTLTLTRSSRLCTVCCRPASIVALAYSHRTEARGAAACCRPATIVALAWLATARKLEALLPAADLQP